MKFVQEDWDFSISIDPKIVSVLVIEDPVYLRLMIEDIKSQLLGEENGTLVLSHDDQMLTFSKSVDLIVDPFALDLNQRKLIAGLYKEIERQIQEGEGIKHILTVQRLLNEVLEDVDQDLFGNITWASLVDITAILKLMNVRFEQDWVSMGEKLITYMKMYRQYVMKDGCFICVHLKEWFSLEEFNVFVKQLRYEDIPVLFIESRKLPAADNEQVWIIDKDGCFIY